MKIKVSEINSTGIQAAAAETMNPETLLCDLPESEFLTGTVISEAVKQAGFTDSAKTVINNNGWWSLTVSELLQQLANQ
jgi:hypothetical protein